MARRPMRTSVLAGALTLALAAATVTGCSDSSGNSNNENVAKDKECTPGTGLGAKMVTDDPGKAGEPDIAKVPEAAGKSRSGGSGDTLVDMQNFSGGEPGHIDPALADTLQGAQIPVLLYDGLTDTDYDGKIIPKLAEKWTVNDDATVFTFTLKPNQTFSNGEAITASTFKKSWERALNPKLASTLAYHMSPIKGADEVNKGEAKEISGVVADDAANTLTITLSKPFADFPAVLGHPVFSPVPKAAIEAADPTTWEAGVMVGNGPYAMNGPWKHDDSINLTANEKYTSGEPAKTKNIQFIISKDVDSQYNSFRAGKADTALIPPSQFTKATETYKSITDPYDAVYKFEIGQDNPCLGGPNNLKLRQALSMAIDRERINKQVYDGSRIVASGLTPPGVEGFKTGLCDYCKYDVAKAKQLVKEWKADGGHLKAPIKIGTNTGSGHEPVVAIIVENFKAIGIPAKLDGLNPDTWTDDLRKEGGCEFCRSSWVWDYPIYDNDLSAQYLSSGVGSDNWSRFESKEFDDAIAKARATTNADERNKTYRQAEKLLLDNVVTVPITWYRGQVVYDNRVEGLRMSPLNFFSYEEATVK